VGGMMVMAQRVELRTMMMELRTIREYKAAKK
jgi:hypothetical protein